MKHFIKSLAHYADFGSRARRREFWFFVLFNFIFGIAAIIIDALCGWQYNIDRANFYGPCYTVFAVGMFLPALAAAVRRLHDTGRSGWWMFIGLIPLVGQIWLIVLLCSEGKADRNRYGVNPKQFIARFTVRERFKSIGIAFITGAVLLFVSQIVNIPFRDIFEYPSAWAIINIVLFNLLVPVCAFIIGLMLISSRDKIRAALICVFVLGAAQFVLDIISAVQYSGISVLPYMLQGAAMMGFAAAVLKRWEKKTLTALSVALIVITAFVVVWKLYVNYGVYSNYLFAAGNIVLFAFILLAAHFLSRKEVENTDVGSSADGQNLIAEAANDGMQPAGKPAEQKQGGLAGKILGAIVSIGLIIGGASGEFVLRGTNSSVALIIAGILFLIWDIYSIIKYFNNKRDQDQDQDQKQETM